MKKSLDELAHCYDAEHRVQKYVAKTASIGLWKSEAVVFEQWVPRGAKILDLGCGAGRTTFALASAGWSDLVGVDLSANMIAAARAQARELKSALEFEEGDATALRFTDRTFDVVFFSHNGLMAIPDGRMRLRAVQEARRVLVDGGLFVFTTHDRDLKPLPDWYMQAWRDGTQDERYIDFGDFLYDDDLAGFYLHIPDRAEVEAMVAETGLKLLETKKRSDLAVESELLLRDSFECRFFVARK